MATASSGIFRKQLPKPLIAQAAGRAFDRVCRDNFGCVARGRLLGSALCFGSDVDAGFVEGNVEPGSQIAAEFKVGIGFRSAQAVMQMRRVEDEAEFPALLSKSTQQCDGIRAA